MVTVTRLGTAATMPLPDRALTTALLAWEGHSLLFDCGEGTQAAALRAELRELGLPAEIVGELTERRETEILVTND